MYIVYETLQNLGISGKKIITIFNKQDKVLENEEFRDFHADKVLKISAVLGNGLDELKSVLEMILREDKQFLEGIFSYEQGGQISTIRKYGELLEEEFRENGVYIKAFVPVELYHNLEEKMEAEVYND